MGLDKRDPDLGGARFPPKVWPTEKDIAAVQARWKELGLDKTRPKSAPKSTPKPKSNARRVSASRRPVAKRAPRRPRR